MRERERERERGREGGRRGWRERVEKVKCVERPGCFCLDWLTRSFTHDGAQG